MAKVFNHPGFGKIKLPSGWQKPCKAGQWSDGVLTFSSVSTMPWLIPRTNDIPLAIASDGFGGAFVLSICNQDWFTTIEQGPFALRPVSATGKAGTPILFGEPRAWIGVIGIWSEAAVVPSGPGRCILAGGKTQFGAFGNGSALEAQRFDQASTPLWNGGNPVRVSSVFPPSSSLGNPHNLVGEPDGSDGAIFAWLMPNAAFTEYTIQIQRIAANGNTQWGVDGVSFGTASGPVAYYQTPWIQLVPDQNGGAIVLAPQMSGAVNGYNAYVFNGSGTLMAGPVTVIAGIPNGWIGIQRLRRAVTDGNGGLILAYADINERLHILRFQPSTGVAWDVDLGELIHPAAFHIYEDDRGGALVTFFSTRGLLELRRIAANGTTTWDITTAQKNVPLQPIIPKASIMWRADQWSRFAQAVPKGDGGAVLIFQFRANRVAQPRLHSICFDSSGSPISPEQEITARQTAHEFPIAIPVGGAAVVAWADDGNAANTGLDVWLQRVGCCPPEKGGLEPWPPFGCEIIDFSGAGFGEMILKLPCGNNEIRLGLIPLSRLVANVRGLDFPGSITNQDVPSPDWMQIHFYSLPEKTKVQLFDGKGKMVAEAQPDADKNRRSFDVTCQTLTFKPLEKEDPLLVFTNTGKLETDGFSIHLESEWGNGKPPKGRHRSRSI